MLLLSNNSNNLKSKNNNDNAGRFSDPKQNSVKQTISGTLEILTLFDLTMSLNSNKKSGKLNVHTTNFEACLILNKGEIVHADYFGMTGEQALINTFVKADGDSNAQFVFESENGLDTNIPVSISMPFKELLFKVAMALDHHRKL